MVVSMPPASSLPSVHPSEPPVVRILRVLLAGLGLAALAIGSSIWSFGAQAVARTCETAFATLTGWTGPLSPDWPPTMDSEMRFYAAIWGAYGVALVVVARNLARRLDMVPWLAAPFFLGGVGRVLSWAQVGTPHPFFQLLMAIELALPPLFVGLWWVVQRKKRGWLAAEHLKGRGNGTLTTDEIMAMTRGE